MAISRCGERLATTVPPKGQLPFHHFSPFRGNVEIISIVHSSLIIPSLQTRYVDTQLRALSEHFFYHSFLAGR